MKDRNGMTAAMHAAASGKPGCLSMLLEFSDGVDNDGNCCLVHALSAF